MRVLELVDEPLELIGRARVVGLSPRAALPRSFRSDESTW
jgi:hypothetical protein